jgi:hypothetical protein
MSINIELDEERVKDLLDNAHPTTLHEKSLRDWFENDVVSLEDVSGESLNQALEEAIQSQLREEHYKRVCYAVKICVHDKKSRTFDCQDVDGASSIFGASNLAFSNVNTDQAPDLSPEDELELETKEDFLKFFRACAYDLGNHKQQSFFKNMPEEDHKRKEVLQYAFSKSEEFREDVVELVHNHTKRELRKKALLYTDEVHT